MSKYDHSPRTILRNLTLLGIFAFAVAACTPSSAQPETLPLPTPIVEAAPNTLVPPTEQFIIVTTDASQIQPTNTPEIVTPTAILPTLPAVQILTDMPPQWITGETEEQMMKRMSDTIRAQIAATNPDQYAEAQNQGLPENYLNAVVNIDYESEHPWGGTATFIGVNPATNESLFITASHVLLDDTSAFHIKQPHSGTDIVLTGDQMTIARAPEGNFYDLAVVKLNFIPEGIQTFPITGTDLCVTQQPVEGTLMRAFAFPYMNLSEGGKGFTEFMSVGGVEVVGDDATGKATCWWEANGGALYIPTTMPTRPGTSGALVLDAYNQSIGIMKALSPHGAAVMPIDKATLATLVAQTGFTSLQTSP